MRKLILGLALIGTIGCSKANVSVVPAVVPEEPPTVTPEEPCLTQVEIDTITADRDAAQAEFDALAIESAELSAEIEDLQQALINNANKPHVVAILTANLAKAELKLDVVTERVDELVVLIAGYESQLEVEVCQ